MRPFRIKNNATDNPIKRPPDNAEKKLKMITSLIEANDSDIKKLLLLQNEK